MGAVREEIFKCDTCGNVVFVMEGGDGDLVCGGEEMKLLTSDEAKASHSACPNRDRHRILRGPA